MTYDRELDDIANAPTAPVAGTLTYPGNRRDLVGQVVGPNWLGEYFRIDATQMHGVADENLEEAATQLSELVRNLSDSVMKALIVEPSEPPVISPEEVKLMLQNTVASVVLLRKDGTSTIDSRAKAEFVLNKEALERREAQRGFRPVASHRQIREAFAMAHKPWLWFSSHASRNPAEPGPGSSVRPSSAPLPRVRIPGVTKAASPVNTNPAAARPDRRKQVKIAKRAAKERRR